MLLWHEVNYFMIIFPSHQFVCSDHIAQFLIFCIVIPIFYHLQTKLQKGVCVKNSVHRGCTPPVQTSLPLCRHPPGQTHPLCRNPPGRPPGETTPGRYTPWSTHPLGRHPLGRHPLGRPPPLHQMATAADGTHPTGMHSCSYLILTVFQIWKL